MAVPLPSSNDRSLVTVIDGNAKNRALLAQSLMSFYRVAAYGDVEQALDSGRQAPAVLVVDDRVEGNARGLVRSLRADGRLRGTRIVLCKSPDRVINRANSDDEPDAVLDKPYRRSQLISTISHLLNRSVEDKWAQLPETPREALTKTVSTFNGISDLIEKGEPLEYKALGSACAPLVEAVGSNEYKMMLGAVRGHDNYSYVHSLRVATLLTLFGHTIGLKGDALSMLACGGLVHDIGKMSIPHEVLNKPGKLSDEEWLVMRSHVDNTVGYLKSHSDVPKGVITIAEQHHEKLSGKGYPHGLAGSELNDLARMAAIVDVFSALTDRRVYKPPMAPEEALTLMTGPMGDDLDTRFLGLFREMLLDAASDEWT